MYASPRQLPYAPTPYSYTPSSHLSATVNLDEVKLRNGLRLDPTFQMIPAESFALVLQEVKLSTNPSSRDLYDSLAEIYGIIITLDALEKAYIKDSVNDADYTDICNRLLKQYKNNLTDETVAKEFVDLETFKREWDIDCPRATERLRSGLPLTTLHATQQHPSISHHRSQSQSYASSPNPTSGPPPSVATGTQILTATENFITFLDALKLGMLSKDQLHPLLSDVIQSVNRVAGEEFEGRVNIIRWLIKLNGMRATEELDEEAARELSFDIEGAYNGFKGTLN
ncbi:Vacuolar protein-sorting-associated protein 28 [Agyrium rufum]|nr:Vacuolar protein-sorting-associated protein 28 [Agyrium rufum]